MKLNDLLFSDYLGIYALFKYEESQPNKIAIYDLRNKCVRVLDKREFRVIKTPLFREGDIVTGIEGFNFCGVPNEESTYKVETLQGTEDMTVRVITHQNEDNIGDTYYVRKVFFRLAERKGNFRR